MFCRPPRVARRPPLLLHFAPNLEITAAPSSLRAGFGAAERLSMDDEARATGLDPVPDRAPPRRPRRGRRSPYRHPRQRHDGGGGRADVSGPTYAALDLGTNNCRLLVARADRATASASSMRSPASSGWARASPASGRLSEAAIVRAVEALRVCRDKMRNRGVTRARLIATEACRSAGERRRVPRARARRGRHRARDRRSRDRGAACRHRLHAAGRSGRRGRDPVRHRRRLLRAGAARPLAPCRHGPPHPEIAAWVSLPVGVVTLAERHGGVDVTPRDLRGDDRGGRGLSSTASPPSTAAISTACICSAPRAP